MEYCISYLQKELMENHIIRNQHNGDLHDKIGLNMIKLIIFMSNLLKDVLTPKDSFGNSQ